MTCDVCAVYSDEFNKYKEIRSMQEFICVINISNEHMGHMIDKVNNKKGFTEYLANKHHNWVCLFPHEYVTNKMFNKYFKNSVIFQDFKAWTPYRYRLIDAKLGTKTNEWLLIGKHIDIVEKKAYLDYTMEDRGEYMETAVALVSHLKHSTVFIKNIDVLGQLADFIKKMGEVMEFEEWRVRYLRKQGEEE